jgi:hypothetical protein
MVSLPLRSNDITCAIGSRLVGYALGAAICLGRSLEE